MVPIKTGSCVCGAVSFTVKAELKAPDACHCVQCRKHSGHYFASTDVQRSAIDINRQDKLTWHQASAKVRRGFCSVCGASLFFDPLAADWIGVAMGAFDTPTLTQLEKHIFVAEKGDYYPISDGLQQNPR
jgi:hypothetical protein